MRKIIFLISIVLSIFIACDKDENGEDCCESCSCIEAGSEGGVEEAGSEGGVEEEETVEAGSEGGVEEEETVEAGSEGGVEEAGSEGGVEGGSEQ